MQFNLVNKKEMLVFQCIWVHDGAICLAVSGLKQMCTGSCRSCGLSVVAIWSRGWLITVEASEHPRDPPSTQPDPVFNNYCYTVINYCHKGKFVGS